MSKCISRHGEYSEHTFGGDEVPEFTCSYCWVFDEDAALAEIARLRAAIVVRPPKIARLSAERDRYRSAWKSAATRAGIAADRAEKAEARGAERALLEAADEVEEAELHQWLNPARGAAVWLRTRADQVEAKA